MKAKYLIIKVGNIEQPVVFSELMAHSDVALGIGGTVVGAGFCYINDLGRYQSYGESVSCRVKSREEDSDILNRLLGVDSDY